MTPRYTNGAKPMTLELTPIPEVGSIPVKSIVKALTAWEKLLRELEKEYHQKQGKRPRKLMTWFLTEFTIDEDTGKVSMTIAADVIRTVNPVADYSI